MIAVRASFMAAEPRNLEARLRQPFWPSEKKYLGLLALAVMLGAVLRSIRLMSLFPVLVDEAIYLRWAEIIQHRHTWFISLLDAKPPLIYWIYAGLRLIFRQNPLLGNRLVSVAAGTLAVLVLYRIGCLCSGVKAGLITAFLYALLPFGVLYDRLAYVDSMVNLCGACLVCASLMAFGGRALSWRHTVTTGLVLGVSLCIKTTVLLFGLAPLTLGIYFHRRDLQRLVPHILAVYGVAALFPLWLQLSIPSGPTFSVNNVILHHTNFFTPAGDLLHHPLRNLGMNMTLLTGYATAYIGYFALLSAVAGVIVLLAFRHYLPLVILLTCAFPFALIAVSLEYFPSRYVFPLVWPLLLLIGCAAAPPLPRLRWHSVIGGTIAVVLTGMLVQSIRLVSFPNSALHERDADEFLGPGPYSGDGVLPAIAMLRSEARGGPITILTDPWWGPPTDTIFAYLNEVQGTRVYEAWWLQLDGEYPLVPSGLMPVWRSQYERVADSGVDFSSLQRLYYITDTNYFTPEQVRAESPSARLVGHFPKSGGQDSIDVYRLN